MQPFGLIMGLACDCIFLLLKLFFVFTNLQQAKMSFRGGRGGKNKSAPSGPILPSTADDNAGSTQKAPNTAGQPKKYDPPALYPPIEVRKPNEITDDDITLAEYFRQTRIASRRSPYFLADVKSLDTMTTSNKVEPIEASVAYIKLIDNFFPKEIIAKAPKRMRKLGRKKLRNDARALDDLASEEKQLEKDAATDDKTVSKKQQRKPATDIEGEAEAMEDEVENTNQENDDVEDYAEMGRVDDDDDMGNEDEFGGGAGGDDEGGVF